MHTRRTEFSSGSAAATEDLSVLVKWIRRIIKPKVISHRTCLHEKLEDGQMSGQEAKVIAANNNSNCSAVTIFCSSTPGCSGMRSFGHFWVQCTPNNGQHRTFYYPARWRWRFKCIPAKGASTSTSAVATLFGQCRRHDAAIKSNK